MNKKAALCLFLFCFYAFSQNPASEIKDNSLSMPEKTFEVFWKTFDDNYAFFDLKKIDWKAVYKKYRPTVNSETSNDSLFSVLSQITAPLYDDHVNIIIPNVRQFTAEKPSPFLKEFPTKASRDSLWAAVNETLYKNGFAELKFAGPEYKGKKLFSYACSNTYGYIRIERCFASSETEDEPEKDAVLAGIVLDSVLQQMGKTKALVLDLRSNIGGNDEFAYAVAGRFAASKIVGHYKQTRITGTRKFTPLEKWYITPLSQTPYTKPLVILTNDQTASAGDVLAMIMTVLPNTVLAGENTLGIYSDMYGFELPNKWLVSLSNQKYFSSKMVCYEGEGTPVNITVRNTRQDIKTMEDPVVLTALKHLNKEKKF